MKNKFNKKAILFSLISVLFSVLFITIFSQNFNTANEDRIPGSNIRIKVMDTYARNFEIYIGDSLKTSTYLTLNSITLYRDNNGKFFNNFNEFNTTFYNCMMCGYVNCASQISNNNCSLGQEYFDAKLKKIVLLSNEQLNIKTTYKINSIQIINPQTYPFEVEVQLNISYNITDNSSDKYARWNKQKIITESVSIIGLIDPKGYINDTTNTYNRTISRYTGLCEYDESCWNITTTTEFYQERSFRVYHNATSFLQRYWDNRSPSDCCGIETILHPGTFGVTGTDLDITKIDRNSSYTDNYYWNNYSCQNGYDIVNILIDSNNIHLDENTAARYGLTAYGTSYCVS